MTALPSTQPVSRKATINLEDGLKVEIIFLKGKLYPIAESTDGFSLWESPKVACFYDINGTVLEKNHFVSYNNELFKVEFGKRLRKALLMKIVFSNDWLHKNKVLNIVSESKDVAISTSFPTFFPSDHSTIYKLLHTTELENINKNLLLKSLLFSHINSILESLKDPKHLHDDEIKIKWVVDSFFKPLEFTIPSISEITNKLSMSESRFKRIFKDKTGVPYYHFCLKKSMEQAEHWLMYENLSVKEIAHNLGYSQPVSFINQFKKTFGDPPLQYKIKRSRGVVFNSQLNA